MDYGKVQYKGKQVRSEPKYKGLGVWKTKFGLSVSEPQFSVKGMKSVNLRGNRKSLQHRTSGKTFDIMWLLTYFEKTIYMLFVCTVFKEIRLCINCLYINITIIFPKPVRTWTSANHLALDAESPSHVKVMDHMKTNTNKGSYLECGKFGSNYIMEKGIFCSWITTDEIIRLQGLLKLCVDRKYNSFSNMLVGHNTGKERLLKVPTVLIYIWRSKIYAGREISVDNKTRFQMVN